MRRVTLTVSVPEQDATREFVLPTAGPSLSHQIASVPIGLVEVNVSAESAAGEVFSGMGAGVIRAAKESLIYVALVPGPSTPSSAVSTAFEVVFVDARPATEAGSLVLKAALPSAPWGDYRDHVQQRFGASVEVSVQTLRLDLDRRESHEIEKLRDLWTRTVDAELRYGTSRTALGSVRLGDDDEVVSFTVSAEDLRPALDFGELPPELAFEGTAQPSSERDHTARLAAILVLSAAQE